MVNFGDNQKRPGPEMFCVQCSQFRDTIFMPVPSSIVPDTLNRNVIDIRIKMSCELRCDMCGSKDLTRTEKLEA